MVVDLNGVNGYVCFYKGKQVEVYANTTYEAQKKGAELLKAKKSYDVSVVLAMLDGKEYINKGVN